MNKNNLLEELEKSKDAMVNLQKNLSSIPALGPDNGGEGELKKALFLKKWIKENLGIEEFLEVNAPDKRVPSEIRPNYIFLYPGKNKNKTIWIMTHLDVVPPGDLSIWKNDPYSPWVEDDKLYGRGVEDNQQDMVASLFALKILRDKNILPDYRVGLVFVSDEETGSKKGITYVLEEKPDLIKKHDLIIVPDAGAESGLEIEVAEKSILWTKFLVTGKSAHASTPELGVNAHRASANLIVELDKLNKIFDKKDKVYDPPPSTFEPTKKEENVPNINTIPGEDIFYIDARILPDYPLEKVQNEIKKIVKQIEDKFNVKIKTSHPQIAEAAPPTPENAEIVRKLSKAIEYVFNNKTKVVGIGGGTVAAEFRRKGLNVAVWSKIEDVCHQPNEYILIDNMVKDAKVFLSLFIQEQ